MENKTAKYFKYAIGEIILVVIGILIALQVNNWNESRKDNKQEIYVLKQLYQEFKSDSIQLDRFIMLTSNKAEDGKLLRKAILNNKKLSRDTLAFNAFFNGRIVLFESFTPTFDELLASGSLKLISNETLKNEIRAFKQDLLTDETFSYYEKQQIKKDYNLHLYEYFEPEIMTYLWKNAPKGTVSIDSLNTYSMNIEGFYKDPKTIFHINNSIGVDSELSWKYKDRAMIRLASLLRNLKEEIDKYHD